METANLLPAALGGILAGLGAVGFLFTHGRIAGVTGLVVGAVDRRSADRGSRAAYLAGIVAAGCALALLAPGSTANGTPISLGAAAVAGVIVGLGSRLANGCTSGHGVCGVGRLSPRSMAAVTVFSVSGMLSLLVTRAIVGGAP